MPDIKSKINKHSRCITQESTPPTNLLNCIKKETCFTNQLCLTKNILYKASINCDTTTNHGNKLYNIHRPQELTEP